MITYDAIYYFRNGARIGAVRDYTDWDTVVSDAKMVRRENINTEIQIIKREDGSMSDFWQI